MLRGDNRRAMHALRWFAALVALGIAFTAAAQQEPLPTLPELEAQGATIGEIRVETQNIFDVDDPHESALPYRAAAPRRRARSPPAPPPPCISRRSPG